MSFNYENRREVAANNSYQASVLAKRDLLAQRIKNGNKTTEIDISKVLEGVKNGDLSVLEELDRAGISYTLTNNGQPFDGKADDDYYFACEYNGTTYTAEHKALTREQEEAKKKSDEPIGRSAARLSFKKTSDIPFISISKAIDIMEGKAVNRTTAEEPKKKAVQEPAPAKDNRTTTVTEVNVNNLLNNTVNTTAEPANTSTNTTTGSTSSANGTDSVQNTSTNNTGITVENIMEKYGYNRDFAQLILDYISDRASKEATNTSKIAELSAEMFNNLDEIVNPDLDKNDTFNDRQSGSVSYEEYPIDGSMVRKWDFLKFMLQKVIGDDIYEVFDKLKYEPVDSDTFEYFLNSGLSKYYKAGRDIQYSYSYILNEFSVRLRDELKGETNKDYSNDCRADSSSYYFRFGSLCEYLDKNGNGFIDELYQKLTEYFTPLRNDATYILEHCKDNNGAKVNLYLEEVLGEIEEHAQQGIIYGRDTSMTGDLYSELIKKLEETGINYIVNTDIDANGSKETVRFTYNGIYYEISYRYNSEKADTRSIDEVTDEQLDEYLQRYDSTPGAINWAIMLGEENPYKDSKEYNFNYPELESEFMMFMRMYPDDVYFSNGSGKYYAYETEGGNIYYQLGQLLQKEYGITKESSNEEIRAKLKEYLTSLGLDLSINVPWEKGTWDAKEALKDSFITIEKDLMNRFPEYKNILKENYLALTNPGRESHEYTIVSKPTENKYDYNSPESVLERNLEILKETGNYDTVYYIKDCLDKLNIKYDMSQGSSVIHFTYKGLDYEISMIYEDLYGETIVNTKTIDDVTDDEINQILDSFSYGYFGDLLFWDGQWNDSPYFPDYRIDEDYYEWLKNAEDNMDDEEYRNHVLRNSAHAVDKIVIDYLINILTTKCGIEDYKASKEENKKAFIEYLKSIDAYTRDDKVDRTKIDWHKVYRELFEENPTVKRYVLTKALGQKSETPHIGVEEGVIIRTRPTTGETEPLDENADYGQNPIYDRNNKNGYTDVYYKSKVIYD